MNVTSIEKVVSANAVSVAGVCLAAVAARMFLSDSVRVRQLGVVLFKARDFMDSLDGFVARASKKQVNKQGGRSICPQAVFTEADKADAADVRQTSVKRR